MNLFMVNKYISTQSGCFMDLKNIQFTYNLKGIAEMTRIQIQNKSFHFHHELVKDCLTSIYVIEKMSFPPIIQQLTNIRNEILQYFSPYNYCEIQQKKQQSLSNIYLTLAMISQKIGNGQAQRQYQSALSYDQNHPQINLSFALFLFYKQQYKKALKHIKKLEVSTAYTLRHRKSIWKILIQKVKLDIYQLLYKSKKSEQQMAKISFAQKIVKFKQTFLYHCVEIKELSQNSYLSLAYLLFHTNRRADAVTLSYKLRNINQPPTESMQKNLAYLFLSLSEFEESIECAKQGLKINPQNQDIYIYLILSLISTYQYSQAKVFAIKLVKINRFNSVAYQLLAGLQSTRDGLESSKLAVVISPSESTYLTLATSLNEAGKFSQAQRYYLRSIKKNPIQSNFSRLGQLYFKRQFDINAMLCFFQAIKQNCFNIKSYLYLGFMAKKTSFFTSIINRFMDSLKSSLPQNLFVQTLLGVYKFLSNQSQEQIYSFLSKFVEERKKGDEQTLYSDIADHLIKFELIALEHSFLFVIIMGVLSKAKGRHHKARRIYCLLISKFNKNSESLSVVFTKIYQAQISKTPKELQSLFLQFLLAEMVQENLDQTFKCFYKALSYASGEYEHFYAQLYKLIENDIDQLQKIEFLASCMIDMKSMDQDDFQMMSQTLLQTFIEGLPQYQSSLQSKFKKIQVINGIFQRNNYQQQMRNLLKDTKNTKSNKLEFQMIKFTSHYHPIETESSSSKKYIPNVYQMMLNDQIQQRRVTEPQIYYNQIFQRIQIQRQSIRKNAKNILKIYNEREAIQQLKFLADQYSDDQVLSQKVIFIFNWFHRYIITESCHKQFAQILHKIKQFPYYRCQQMREDLQKLFSQGNKHTNKVYRVQYAEKSEQFSQISSEVTITEGQQIISLNQQTKSQFEACESSSFFDELEAQENCKNQYYRQNSESYYQSNNNQIKPQKPSKINANPTLQVNQILGNSSEDEQTIESELLQRKSSNITLRSSILETQNWHSLTYSNRNTQFIRKRLYNKFNQLLFHNTFFIVKFLSTQQKLQYIAKHICLQNYEALGNSFQAKVQLADEAYIINKQSGSKQESTLKWIQALGQMHMLRWIADIAMGISELEDLGIYHADLFFRNTIRVRLGNKFYFKIIDFDKAFKVEKTYKANQPYESTKSLFDFWLRFRFEDCCSRAPLYNLAQSQSQYSQKSNESYDPQEIIKYIFVKADQNVIQDLLSIKKQSIFSNEKRIGKCLKLLSQHMRVSHIQQYSSLVQQLLGRKQQDRFQKGQLIKLQIADEILENLQGLKQGKADYIQFAKAVKRIGKIQQIYNQEDCNI